jgi:hypothetical protein
VSVMHHCRCAVFYALLLARPGGVTPFVQQSLTCASTVTHPCKERVKYRCGREIEWRRSVAANTGNNKLTTFALISKLKRAGGVGGARSESTTFLPCARCAQQLARHTEPIAAVHRGGGTSAVIADSTKSFDASADPAGALQRSDLKTSASWRGQSLNLAAGDALTPSSVCTAAYQP